MDERPGISPGLRRVLLIAGLLVLAIALALLLPRLAGGSCLPDAEQELLAWSPECPGLPG